MEDRATRLARAMGRSRALRGRGATRRPEPRRRVRDGRVESRTGRPGVELRESVLVRTRQHRPERGARRGALGVDADAARARGARIAEGAVGGRDKLVLRPPAPVAGLADWIEQLVAESTGKDGRGIVPVVDDPITAPRRDTQIVSDFAADPLALGTEFLAWAYTTEELCIGLGVNAFDQPDVEEAKALARAELARERAESVGAQHVTPLPTLTPEALRRTFRPGDYLAILAYLPPTPDIAARLQAVRAAWARALGGCATTLGFGPRYLHSTGQLHKGGPNTGLFLVVTADDAEDADIPEMGISFGRLKRAQLCVQTTKRVEPGRYSERSTALTLTERVRKSGSWNVNRFAADADGPSGSTT